ncbi:MAG: SDR family NAD(P)-dependent oxidoreductase, partial [Deltaproteobacteria bacterium]|nr:SDR family NAD(P)-dependent oxidoreductase [Deltaproteobacteria bacterium]
KCVVVTGAGRGIGRGHSMVLASEGARVVVNDVDRGEAESVVKEIEAAGGVAAANGDDIGTRSGCEALVAQCVSEFGRIDAAINNAGIVRDRSFLKMTDEEFDDVFRIHAKSTFWVSQAAAIKMRQQGDGGCLINTTSGAHMGNFGQTNYAAAKGAIASMTYTWALELARYGIRVNCIAPAASTRMTTAAKDPDGNLIELPFWDPALNTPLVAYMISDEGDWVTGQVFATGMERIGVMRQPSYGKTLVREGGWDVQSVRRFFKDGLGPELERFGLGKAPYPYYEGLKPS